MKLLIAFLTIGSFLISCSDIKKNKEKNSFVKIDGWNVHIERGITDTLHSENWNPKPEVHLQFINTSEPTCLKPYLNFYPIELEEYMERNLRYYLMLRASLYPPAPNTYTTDKYYIVGWNLVDYDTLKCCDCKNLESELIKKLNFKVKDKNFDKHNTHTL